MSDAVSTLSLEDLQKVPKPKGALRVLHTSDWHIGKRLRNEARDEDFGEFLTWLVSALDAAQIDALLVAGDIFDTTTPSNKAQALYYHFLGEATGVCRHIVVTAGNHDSAGFLQAPKSFLLQMGVRVVGAAGERIEDDVFALKNAQGETELIVAAVPYLREKDVRGGEFGESLSQKQKNTALGVADRYQKTGAYCQSLQQQIHDATQKKPPIVAMGHLFATKASVASDDDGMRDLYVGSLGAVDVQSFGEAFDYVALGHIHKEQAVGGKTRVRYSGSPLAMGFGEAYQQKFVNVVEFLPDLPLRIYRLKIPTFRHLERLRGDFESLQSQLDDLLLAHKNSPKAVWLDIEYLGAPMPSLGERIDEKLKNSPLVALNLKNKTAGASQEDTDALKDLQLQSLQPRDVFAKLLERRSYSQAQKTELIAAHETLLAQIYENEASGDF